MHARQAQGRTPLSCLILVWAVVLIGPAACGWTRGPSIPVESEPSPAASPSPSLVLSASPSLIFTAAPDCTVGRIDTLDVPTTHLEKPLHASVYLPPCYAEQRDQRYPVLYLFHGQTSTDDQWIRVGAPRAADRLIAAGRVPAFIIVMPYDPLWKEPTEYGFAEAVIDDLLPAIDARYRTRPDRLHRAVGGLSRGSGWAFHLGLTRPDLFGAIGAHSVIVFNSDGPLVDNWLAAIPPGCMPRLYLDIGDHDSGLASAKILEDMLTAANVPHEWHLNLGYHDEVYWSAHVDEYLRWYAAGW